MTQSNRSQKKPISVVHLASGDLWAGAESQLYTLASALQKHDSVAVEFIVLNDGQLTRSLRSAGCSVTVVDEGSMSSLMIFFRLVKVLKRLQPDLLHTHRRKENVLGALAAKVAGISHSVRTVHGFDEHVPGPLDIVQRVFNLIDHYVAVYVQEKIFAVSRPLFDDLIGRYQSKVSYIANGIDVESVQEAATLDQQTGVESDCINVAFVGRLVPVKRIDLFLQTANIVNDRAAGDFKFHIFGDGPEKKFVETYIAANKLEESVLTAGFVSDIAAELTKMNLLLITSDSEGLPMALLEAVVLNVAVVARPVGDVPSVLNDGQGGRLIDSADPEEFAGVVLEYQRNKEDFLARAHIAQANVISKYSSVVNGNEYLKVYREILYQE